MWCSCWSWQWSTASLLLGLEQALAALDPQLREVVLLRDVEGFTGPEVARELGILLEAMKSRLHRARTAMRAALQGATGGAPSSG